MNGSPQNRGFSLIELMIVLVIVAILAAVAIPSYRRYVIRSHRVEAQTALVDLAAREERFYYSNNRYTSDLKDLNAESTMAGTLYEMGIASASSSAYKIEAKALGTQKDGDKACATLTLNNLGAQGSTGDKDNDPKCWSK